MRMKKSGSESFVPQSVSIRPSAPDCAAVLVVELVVGEGCIPEGIGKPPLYFNRFSRRWGNLALGGVEATGLRYEASIKPPSCCLQYRKAVNKFGSGDCFRIVFFGPNFSRNDRTIDCPQKIERGLELFRPPAMGDMRIVVFITLPEISERKTHSFECSQNFALRFKLSRQPFGLIHQLTGRLPVHSSQLAIDWSNNVEGNTTTYEGRHEALIAVQPEFYAAKVEVLGQTDRGLRRSARGRRDIARDCQRDGAAHDNSGQRSRPSLVILHGPVPREQNSKLRAQRKAVVHA